GVACIRDGAPASGHTVGRHEVTRGLGVVPRHLRLVSTPPRAWRPVVLSQQKSSRKDPDSEREVFRSPGSLILSWAWFVVAVIILVDLAVQGRDHAAAVTAVVVLAITGIVYACAWRPRIVADSAGITVSNPVRDHRVPWALVEKVDVVNAVRVHCAPVSGADRGKVLYSWAVQSSPRSARKAALRREANSQRRGPPTPRPRAPPPPPGAGPQDRGVAHAARGAAKPASPPVRRAPVSRRVGRGPALGTGTACPPGGRPGGGPAPARRSGRRPARGPGRGPGHRRGRGHAGGRGQPGRRGGAGDGAVGMAADRRHGAAA